MATETDNKRTDEVAKRHAFVNRSLCDSLPIKPRQLIQSNLSTLPLKTRHMSLTDWCNANSVASWMGLQLERFSCPILGAPAITVCVVADE